MGAPPAAAPAVELRGVGMDYGTGTPAVQGASFALAAGRFLTILGPSGSGKSTLLRIIAGFEQPTAGEVLMAGRPAGAVPPHRRDVGMVFQRLALFPHMTVAENVGFPLKMRRTPPAEIPARIAGALALVRLDGFGGRRIHQLSGGQQQRVAIARALVFRPGLLLLDEPLAALDRKLREEMQLEFRRIQRELGVTTINVTHDQREALVLSDEIIVMDHGVIRQHAAPADLYRRPADAFVAGFLGQTSFLAGVAAPGGMVANGVALAGTAAAPAPPGTPVRGAIRAEQLRLNPADADTMLDAIITDSIFEGERQLTFVTVPALDAALQIAHHAEDAAAPRTGQAVRVGWRAADLMIFPAADTGA